MDADRMASWPNPFDRDDLQLPTRQQCGDNLYGPETTRLIDQLWNGYES
jgi:hypothetical protein